MVSRSRVVGGGGLEHLLHEAPVHVAGLQGRAEAKRSPRAQGLRGSQSAMCAHMHACVCVYMCGHKLEQCRVLLAFVVKSSCARL